MGGEAPHMVEGFPGPPGPARPQKRTPTNPGQTAFRYPIFAGPVPPTQTKHINNNFSGLTLGGLRFIIYIFIILRSITEWMLATLNDCHATPLAVVHSWTAKVSANCRTIACTSVVLQTDTTHP